MAVVNVQSSKIHAFYERWSSPRYLRDEQAISTVWGERIKSCVVAFTSVHHGGVDAGKANCCDDHSGWNAVIF